MLQKNQEMRARVMTLFFFLGVGPRRNLYVMHVLKRKNTDFLDANRYITAYWVNI